MTLHLQGQPVHLEMNKWAARSKASVKISCGNNIILATLNSDIKPDNMKLSVHYQERLYAAGMIPGGYLKRETKPGDREILISRILDRSYRPVILESDLEHQIMVTVLSYDKEIDNLDVLSSYGIAALLKQSQTPTSGISVLTKVKHCSKNNVTRVNEDVSDADLKVIAAFVGDNLVNIEVDGDHAKPETVLHCLDLALEDSKKTSKLIADMFNEDVNHTTVRADKHLKNKEVRDMINNAQRESLVESYLFNKGDSEIVTQQVIQTLLDEAEDEVTSDEYSDYLSGIKSLVSQEFISRHFNTNSTVKRIDGRQVDEIRDIDIEFNVLPSTHGSAFFSRGLTQCLCSVTIDTEDMSQKVETIINSKGKQKVMLQYTFPPFSVGETGRLAPPSRRDVGHAFLAKKGVIKTLQANSATAMRIVCEILSSDGSSSSASACAASLALKHSGEETTNLVAAISMGLIVPDLNLPMKEDFIILTDISGTEDRYGAMDLKVSGGAKGINAIQMDTKLPHGVSMTAISQAINQGFKAVNKILDTMEDAVVNMTVSPNRKILSKQSMSINKDDIKFIIGKAGANIKNITATTNTNIDIDSQKCTASVVGWSKESVDKALKMIQESTFKKKDSAFKKR